MKPGKSIVKTFSLSLYLLISISMLVIGYAWITRELSQFEKYAQTERTRHIESRKSLIRNQTESAVQYIEYMRSQAEKRLKENLKERVHEAYGIAHHIFQKNVGKRSVEEISGSIHDALYSARWDDHRGYYFAEDLSGTELINRNNPELEGTSVVHIRDSRGEPVFQKILEAVGGKSREGFCSYYWNKPGEPGVMQPKISFVKLFEPLGWIIGAGKYLQEEEKAIQAEVLARIEKIRFGKNGYIFVGKWDGTALTRPARGRNMIGVTDPNGVMIVRELIEKSKSGGGFVSYVMPRLEGQRPSAKISYAAAVPGWGWYVGAGIYVDEIEKVIAEKQASLRKVIRGHIVKIVFLLLFLYGTIFLIVRHISRRLKENVDIFSLFFEKAAFESHKIEEQETIFTEFMRMADSANRMIDERNQARDALERSEKRFRHVIENAPIPMAITEGEDRIEFINRQFTGTFGYTRKEFSTLAGWWKLACPDKRYRKQVKAQISPENREAPGRPAVLDVTAKDGTLRHIMFTHTPMGELGLATLVDITERKIAMKEKRKLQQQLQQAQKMEAIGTLAGGIAHDFNNILAAIIGFTELALIHASDREKLAGDLARVLAAGERARDLVRQILAFSRSDLQERVPVNMERIIKESVKLLRATLPSFIDIHVNVAPGCGAILADPTQLHQVVMNLCTNGAHAMEQGGGTLSLTLERVEEISGTRDREESAGPATYVRLSVEDSGHGMAPALLDRIFDPYFTTKEVGKGSGLGLSVVHGIVENLGGKITVTSRMGKGSIFRVRFPVTDTAEDSSRESSAPLPGGTEKILLVDDEEAVILSGKALLEDLGYRVTAQRSSETAIDLFSREPDRFDLVVTDQTMPKITGMDMAKRLLSIRPDIPIIICSGHTAPASPHREKERGIRKFLSKPVTQRDLANAVRAVLDGSIDAVKP